MVKQDDLDLWLEGSEITEDTEVEFVNEGEYAEMETAEGKKRVFRIGVKLPDGIERVWTMNKSSRRAAARTWGEDTATWVGKKAIVHTLEKDVFGKPKKVIYIKQCL